MSTCYAIVLEKADKNYSAYLPDLPGCIATGLTVREVKRLLREAVVLHINGLREDGLEVPEPRSLVAYLTIGR